MRADAGLGRPGQRLRPAASRTEAARRSGSVASGRPAARAASGLATSPADALPQRVPPEEAARRVWIGRRDEQDGRHAAALEDRPGDLGEVTVAVVEGDEDRPDGRARRSVTAATTSSAPTACTDARAPRSGARTQPASPRRGQARAARTRRSARRSDGKGSRVVALTNEPAPDRSAAPAHVWLIARDVGTPAGAARCARPATPAPRPTTSAQVAHANAAGP